MPSKCTTNIIVAVLLYLLTNANASDFSRQPADERECLEINANHKSHSLAIRQVMSIAEVQQWEALVIKNNRLVSTMPSTNTTVFHDEQCFWEINLYEITDGQFLRWNAYQISLTKALAYRLDVLNPGQLIPVKFLQNEK